MTDPFNLGLPIYEVETVFKGTNLNYNDANHKIFFNAEAFEKTKNPAIKNFLHFLNSQKISDEFTDKISNASEIAKRNVLWRKEYMFLNDILEDLKNLDKTNV